MTFLLLLAAAAAQMTPLDAERAFAADAQKLGQWTAFRKWSTADALMFVPQPVNAHTFLAGKKDPPVSVFWWLGRSYISCDGSYAVNTGPWVRDGGKSVGYFTTVWKRQSDGSWKWIYDAGDTLKIARAEGGDIKPVIASCEGKPSNPPVLISGSREPMVSAYNADNEFDGPQPKGFSGQSADGTLAWSWIVGPAGDRRFVAELWTGQKYEAVIDDQVAAALRP